MIIDSTYFQSKPLQIPNAVSNSSITGNVPTVDTELTAKIAKYEEQLLKEALGYDNYDSLKTAIAADPNLGDAANAKWKDLVYGKQYVYNSKKVEWKGLVQTYGTVKKSLIANYVFYFYKASDVIGYSTTGDYVPVSKNAIKVSPRATMVSVWNEFLEMYQYGYDPYPVISSVTNGTNLTHCYVSQDNVLRSLYQFLRDNDNYGDYTFKIYNDTPNVLAI